MKKILLFFILLGVIVITFLEYFATTIRSKQMDFVLDNKLSALYTSSSAEDLLYDSDFLINEDGGTGELFAVDSLGILTINVENLPAEAYLPYSSILKEQSGFTIYKWRFIAWQKYGSYTVVYRKYLIDVLKSDVYLIILILLTTLISFFFIRSILYKRNEDTVPTFNAVIREMMDQTIEARVICNDQGTIIYVNKAITQKLGYYKHEMIGNQIESILDPKIRDIHKEHFKRLKESKTTRSGYRNIRTLHSDGRILEFELSYGKFTSKITKEEYLTASIR